VQKPTPVPATPPEQTSKPATAKIIYPGALGRAGIELRVLPDGSSEAYLVPSGAAPIPTGVSLIEDKGKYYITCRKRKKRIVFKPEEVVRQKVLGMLIDDFGYPEDHIDVEVGVQMGSTIHEKPADIAVYADASKTQVWLIVETKKPNRKDGIEQLKSYMNPTGAPFGYWTNGVDEKFLLRTGTNDFSKAIWRLPKFGEVLDDLDEPLTRDKLTPVRDLYSVFKDLEQEILAHQTVDTFNEIFKVVFAKLYDERVNLYNATAEAKFRIGLTESSGSVAVKVRKLFGDAMRKWKDVYSENDGITLNDDNIAYCVKALQPFHLIRSGDVLGVAFELLVNQEMKGDMGQYFTPRQVVDMMVKMIAPRIEETICDPACGSGGFLIYAMREVFRFIDRRWDDADDRAEQRKDYAQEKLLGMDNDSRLVRVAKAYMIMENDGRSGIHYTDSLDYGGLGWDRTLKSAIAGRSLKATEAVGTRLVTSRQPNDGVDIILTNPPFAGAIKTPTTLSQYTLATGGGFETSVVRAILFLERCLDMLRPGGRMAIVLPQGLFNNITDQYVRSFVDKNARVLAVVGCHPYTFKPFTLAKTSILFLQKWHEGEYLDNYPIFTAVSVRPGKTKLGRPQYSKDGVTLDCDMDQIAEAFLLWAKKQKLSFVK
jgi:type I restriction enzyme M protein